jgi:hypothetical protein
VFADASCLARHFSLYKSERMQREAVAVAAVRQIYGTAVVV